MPAEPYSVDQALRVAGLRFGSRVHIIDGERRLGFADVDREASRMATLLTSRGVTRGTAVALRISNSFASIAAALGVWRARGTLVPLNPKLAEAEERSICERAGARLRCQTVAATGDIEMEEVGTVTHREECAELAAIAYTSGTTGLHKGVEITHANMLWAAAAVVHTRRDRHDAVAAVVSPLCHLPIFVSHYLARLLSGGTVVVGSFDVERLVDGLASFGITDLPLVPAMISPLLGHPGLRRAQRLRKVTVGSALTPMETKLALAETFPDAEIIEAYGQTESTDGLTMTVGREALERPGTVGRPHSILALAIQGVEGRLLKPGETGEIVCQGPTVMRGYHADPEATGAALRDGWLHTGDLGRMDEEGYLYVTGRLKEIIISGGENISPEEVEAVLLRHRAVAECAVFGLPDPRWGERVAAAVVAREAVSAEALSEHVTRHLARFKRPRQVFFVDTLPKNSAGKVKRQALRESLMPRAVTTSRN